MKIQKPAEGNYPVFMQNYISLIPDDGELIAHLKDTQNAFEKYILSLPESKHEYRYADGKWTIKEIMVHLADAERIFIYRALRYARKDDTPLTGFDENTYVPASRANDRTIRNILMEMKAVRAASLVFIETLNQDDLSRGGVNTTGAPTTVLALVNNVLGHQLHHWNVIKERYI
jgi:uncharacterized damage-inducible protein DinB